MKKRNGLWALVLWLPVVVGCGGNSTMKAIDEPTISYAKSVRSQIADLKAARDVRANVESFAENMASYKTAAVGEHGATYGQIAAIAQEMQAMKQRGAKPQEFQPKLTELEKLAAGLPGEASSPSPTK